MIKLDSLRCDYSEKTIFRDIDLEIDSHLTILGANGSGKSTLAKAICGLISYEGSISVDGKDIQEFSYIQRAKELAYIPTKLEVYDSCIGVEEFVLLSRFAYKKNFLNYSQKDRTIVLDTLEFLNISHLKDSPVSSLSSGESALVLVASALTGQSKIIIFDEPTANLDPYNSKVIAQHIKGLKEYHQVILITHDLHLASFIDSPTLFIKDTKVKYRDDNFFNSDFLQELYGVEFDGLAVKYE